MLLTIDVGNTNTVLGVFDGDALKAHFRIETRRTGTEDEYAATVSSLFALHGLPFRSAPAGAPEEEQRGIHAGIIATVVPPVLRGFEAFLRRYLQVEPVVVGPGTRTGMPVLYENPREVGADRIVNAVAAYERHRAGCLVVDFGTATTLDVVTPRGEYLGGAIAPGIGISADALYRAAAKLPRVEITRPRTVIGKTTVASMQSGLVFGYVGLVDGLVDRMRAEVDYPLRVFATGGLAPLIARESRTIDETDELLTLTGLRIIYDRERRRGAAVDERQSRPGSAGR